jgi:hypothetical protein
MLEKICARLVSGEGLVSIGKDQTMPEASQIYRCMAVNAEFATAIARAREAQQDAVAENIVEMADNATVENWQVVKLRIHTRQWRAAKLAAKKYGDKVIAEHSGPDGGPLQIAFKTVYESKGD